MARFSDRMETAPHRVSGNTPCDCEQCLELRDQCDDCEHCKGRGWRWQHVEGGFLDKVRCDECEGTGDAKEDM